MNLPKSLQHQGFFSHPVNQEFLISEDQRIFPWTHEKFRSRIKAGAKKAGIKTIRVHDLRHSHITMLNDIGFSMKDIGKRVGHKNITVTQRYTHALPMRQKEMADKLDKEFERGLSNGEES